MTYQQVIADAIKLFLTMDAATAAATTGSGLFSFCHAAEAVAIMAVSSVVAVVAITTTITAAATTGFGLFSSSSVADAATITVVVDAAANPSSIYPMGSSILNPLILSDIYLMSAS